MLEIFYLLELVCHGLLNAHKRHLIARLFSLPQSRIDEAEFLLGLVPYVHDFLS